MVATAEEVIELAKSEAYQRSLLWHRKRGCNIIPADPKLDVPLEMKPIAASGCSVSDLSESLEIEPTAFDWFVAKKLSAFAADNEEEYPPGEEPPPEERPKTLGQIGYSELFLIGHLCEFTLLRLRPEELEPYAKRYRIPKAKQYAKKLVRLFGEARERAAKEDSSE